MSDFVSLLAQFLAVMAIVSIHEFAHAYIAYKNGDNTAKMLGRMTLNPIKHFDPFGVLMLVLVGFGWANPVPVNPYNFRRYRWGSFWTAAAGIIANYIMAFFAYALLMCWIIFIPTSSVISGTYLEQLLAQLFYCLYYTSLCFCLFNLLPFYPLDGFRIIDALDRKNGKIYCFLKTYGRYILIGLIGISFLSKYFPILSYIDILDTVLTYGIAIIGKPITIFWQWIFRFIIL